MSGTLFINTSAINTAKVAIEIDGKRFEKIRESKVMKSQTVLPLIEELLKEKHISLKDITGITVITGPGSFTGLRVGVSIANALGFLLQIPVNDDKGLATPTY
ncbi:MAG TPA: tRNA (adenosine(37)-N6)-threonylcarbamoyltransferase complex dimerization subunit type 1 TsaB [Patescibacteria group bacterium]|jgi:tRNA threonylcarbamoyladenosine biosynthesis protein TsaB|nr:tRNA (adenosine(37)-N6)-threonylcarbamoyltransferase complex dimerization subunit type 1 TsaB [Patescibacteria group bacterium]